MISDRVVGAWEAFQARSGGIRRPQSEDEYSKLVALLDELTDDYDCGTEPYASLFDILTNYAHAWELVHEPGLKNPEVAPNEMLAQLMSEHGVSQYELSRNGLVDQGNLSRILAGERGISKSLAKKLAVYFKVKPDLFI